jgi:hypothetical protein
MGGNGWCVWGANARGDALSAHRGHYVADDGPGKGSDLVAGDILPDELLAAELARTCFRRPVPATPRYRAIIKITARFTPLTWSCCLRSSTLLSARCILAPCS